MTDDAVTPEDPKDQEDASVAESDSGNEQDVPPGMLPLVAPVFGRWAFWICAVPFLVYLGGTSFGTYIENVRKTGPAHSMRGYTREHAKRLITVVNGLSDSNESKQLLERLDPQGVIDAMDDENSDLAGIVAQCAKLQSDDLEGLPSQVTSHAEIAKAFLNHFLVLEEMIEQGEEDKILDEHEAFILEQDLPKEQVPQLKDSWYPMLYSIACLASFLAVLMAMPGYLKIPFRISPLAVGVGVVGIVVWLGLWWIDKEFLHLGELLGAHSRAGFNPWKELSANPTWMYVFVGVRLLGLCLVIPIAEEFFSRGFLMRYIEDIDWDQIPMGEATWKGLVGILVYGAMTHPGEILAAIAWFGLITWMYLKTKNVWDCVVAHAVTNALLAGFVLYTNIWELW